MEHGNKLLKDSRVDSEVNGLPDCIIVIGSLRIPAHKTILSSCSDYFDALFRNENNFRPQEGEAKDTHKLLDLDPESVKALVDFEYTGYIRTQSDKVPKLLQAADFLCISSVLSACLDHLSLYSA